VQPVKFRYPPAQIPDPPVVPLPLSVDDAKWLAGLIDATGSLIIAQNGNCRAVGIPRLQIAHLQSGIALQIKAAVGRGHVRLHADRSTHYDLAIWSDLEQLLRAVRPWCRVRGPAIDIMLEWSDVAYLPVGVRNHHPHVLAKIEIRKQIQERLEQLADVSIPQQKRTRKQTKNHK
jgi:hypothetical protein